jgi:hypothetical protein
MNRAIKLIATFMAIAILAAVSISAVTVEELLQQAQSASPQVKRYEINRENSLLSVSKMDVDDGIEWNVNLGTAKYFPLAKGVSIAGEESMGTVFSYDPGFSVSFPAADDEAVWSAGLDTSLKVSKSSAGNISTTGTVTPRAGVERKFDLGYVYDVKDLTRARQLLQIETTYQTNLLNFQLNFLESLKSLMNQEINVEKASRALARSKASLEKAVILKTVSEGTPKYLDLQNSIEGQRISLENAEDKLGIAVSNFESKYGIKYQHPEVTVAEVPSIEAISGGNSSVKLAEYQYQLASEALKNKTAEKTTLGVSGSLSSTLGLGKTVTGSMDVGSTLTYNTSKGWTATGNIDLGWNINDMKFSPSITVAGKYVPSSKTESEQIEIRELEYDSLTAQMDWENALSSYLDDVVDMQSSLKNMDGTIRTALAALDYSERILENEQEKLGLGLVNQTDVDDAEFARKEAQNDLDICYLNVLGLERKISLLQL